MSSKLMQRLEMEISRNAGLDSCMVSFAVETTASSVCRTVSDTQRVACLDRNFQVPTVPRIKTRGANLVLK